MRDIRYMTRGEGGGGRRRSIDVARFPPLGQDLSYFNVNEFGLNIVLPSPESPRPAAVAAAGAAFCADTWQNASACLAEAFPDALLVHSYSAVSGSLSSKALYSWQNAVVVDPGVQSYHGFMIEQAGG